jgi:hypothetical protein
MKYDAFAYEMCSQAKTAIFEFVSPKHQHAVPYKRTNLILLAIRDNGTGNYLKHSMVQKEAISYDLPGTHHHSSLFNSNHFEVARVHRVEPTWSALHKLRDYRLREGFVLKMNNGTWFKWKTKWWHQKLYSSKFFLP